MEHIAKYTRTNHIHDEDRLKHLPRPPAGFPKEDVAVIYVTGDVRLITASLERRGFLDHHCCKLGSVGGLLASGDLKRRLFARAVKVQRRNWSEAGIKRFMALEFEEIWHRAGEIAAFLEINDPSFVAAFPPRKTRNTHAPETAA